jgi:fructose-1,6-bisphosphatase-3
MIDQHYLQLLSQSYPTAADVRSHIIRLRAILSLPKGTEYFFSDLHGEFRAFIHLLNSASGVIHDTLDTLFSVTLTPDERAELARLIYYPYDFITEELKNDAEKWKMYSRVNMYRLIHVLHVICANYTHSHVAQQLPRQYATLLDEMIFTDRKSKPDYIEALVSASVETGIAGELICAMCELIQQLMIDRLHIIGDIFDRGPRADLILDKLMDFHDVDIQWGNHDLCYLGAASGCYALIANAIRVSISYNNFDFLQDGYGINLRALATFAAQVYADDACLRFYPHLINSNKYDKVDIDLAAKMHKAIAVIQFKLEGQTILRHPEYAMQDRVVLQNVDFEHGTVTLDGATYPLTDTNFPTVDPRDPLALTPEEDELMYALASSFRHSERFHKHARFLLSHGSMYKRIDNNLLYHGCVLMDEDGALTGFTPLEGAPKGKACFDAIDQIVRRAYFAPSLTREKHDARDMVWYLTCGPMSPVFAKDKMTTFERYFIDDAHACHETLNHYYQLIEQPKVCEMILAEFGLDPKSSHIINGHVPVRLKQGESPVKSGGRLYIIDGGLSKAYQQVTGIGGYTFIEHCDYVAFAEHAAYDGADERYFQSSPKIRIVERMPRRMRIRDTRQGEQLQAMIDELEELLAAYESGTIHEQAAQPL